jgi:hypothetical protein
MSQTALANTTGVLFSLLTLAGATGVTSQDVQGFVTVIGAIVTAACFIWSHLSHRSAIAAAQVSTQS